MQGGTIGQMEALAGLPSDHASRLAFWLECDRTARSRNRLQVPEPLEVVAVARERCHAMTYARIQRGELCLL